MPTISWTWPITSLGLGTPRPPCGGLGAVPNHGLTWRPCPSQIQGVLSDAQKICWTHSTWFQLYSTSWSKLGTCSICPHHECAHFWRFPAISYSFGPTLTISSPPVHAGRMHHGQHMVCSLCPSVPMSHTPRGRTEAPTDNELCQGKCGQFHHFGTFGYHSAYHHAMAHGDLWHPSMRGPTLVSH